MCFYRLLANFSSLEEAADVYVLTEGPRFLFLEVWARNAPAHQWLDAQWGVGFSQLAAGSPAMSFVLLPQWPLGAWLEEGLLQGWGMWQLTWGVGHSTGLFKDPLDVQSLT